MLKEELWMRLSVVDHLSMQVWRRVEFYFSNQASDTFESSSDLLGSAGLTASQIAQFWQFDQGRLKRTLCWLKKPASSILPISSPYYPQNLQNCFHSPKLLFIEGDASLLQKPQLVMVGSRKSTRYGQFWARQFACTLSCQGFIITSGLARGIDQVVHQEILKNGRKTIAVLGSGFNHIYPIEHTQLATKIVEHGGTLVSEFYPDTKQTIEHFSAKNHLMSALGNGVVVIEATLKSGSLMTARFALEQGKDIFALPGPLGNVQSQGTHWLIKQGATLVSDPLDIIEHLKTNFNWLSVDNPPR